MRQQSEPEGSLLMGCGTLLAQKPQRPTWLPAKLQPWLINSHTGSLTRSCISQLCTPPAASVEPSCPGNFYNLPSIKSLLLWNIKIPWNAEIFFLQTCTALNFSMHYTLFPPLRLKNIVFGRESFQNSVMAANGCHGGEQSCTCCRDTPALQRDLAGDPFRPGQFYYFPHWSAEGRLPKKQKSCL